MPQPDLSIFSVELGGHLAALTTRGPLDSTFDGDFNMTHAIGPHVFDGHIGNVEWNLKGLAHRGTRFSGG